MQDDDTLRLVAVLHVARDIARQIRQRRTQVVGGVDTFAAIQYTADQFASLLESKIQSSDIPRLRAMAAAIRAVQVPASP